ncbi:hypothetical protein KEM56_007395 [Ascosphaera pollenicola]|nr:hypothetical protein KEM56_007395 [Ascosphaera pollenicola]
MCLSCFTSVTAILADPRKTFHTNKISQPLDDATVTARFHPGLLEQDKLEKYKKYYAESNLINNLVDDTLLRGVRSEIQEQVSFTEKETDIYRIFQSGDLANLDGLDDSSLAKLPSLLKLRDALYSKQFRAYLSEVTGSGPLSGKKTDMAINVYTGGCHLLCHDDVIGTRRISYILYLTHPDIPWKPEWGGALRMFPTSAKKDDDGSIVHVPYPDTCLSIPPAFNQLSFFVVQPGFSFHDVEEVYYQEDDLQDEKKQRVRMAISGWFHIPQEGEDGFDPEMEEKLAQRSSLSQLEGRLDKFDLPQPRAIPWTNGESKDDVESDDAPFTEKDLDFLIKYLNPHYLTPDTLEDLAESFGDESSISIDRFLHDKLSARLRSHIEEQEKADNALPASAAEIETSTDWKVSRPPHKHRYLYQQTQQNWPAEKEKTPLQELLEDLLPSQAFKKWLSVATGIDTITTHNFLARRFRRGSDYTLANGFDGEQPQLEFTLNLTPSPGWDKDDEEDDEEENDDGNEGTSKKLEANESSDVAEKPQEEELSLGGYEIYMAGDDDAPSNANDEKSKSKPKLDPAVYRATSDEDDGILFSMPASWNRMSIVLRDQGTLKFVKYVSRSAKGDRWDITGEVGVEFDDSDEENEDGAMEVDNEKS